MKRKSVVAGKGLQILLEEQIVQHLKTIITEKANIEVWQVMCAMGFGISAEQV